MRNFIKNLVIYFWLITSLILFVVYIVGFIQNHSLEKSTEDSNSVYMWGDSQAYQGVNVNKLSFALKREVYSLAQHGSGVYDLLVFSDKVPEGAMVLLQIPKGAQKRSISLDRNDSGLNIFAFKTLWENNYSLFDLFYIVRNNLFTIPKFNKFSGSWEYHEGLHDNLYKKLLFKSYNEIPDYIFDRQNIILTSIRNLINKKCIILLFEIPFHPTLQEFEEKSELKTVFDSFEQKMIKELNLPSDSIMFSNDQNIFFDLTHFNVSGNNMLTDSLSSRLNKLKFNKYLKFKIGVNNN